MAPTYVKQVLFPDYQGAEYSVSKSITSTPVDAAPVDDASCFEAVKKRDDTEKLRCHSKLTFLFQT